MTAPSIRKRVRLITAATVLAAGLLGAAGAARAETPPPRDELLRALIPKPTGKNGYEDFLLAADRVETTKFWRRDVYPIPLSDCRTILEKPAAREALMLLQRGLRKPITVPPPQPDSSAYYDSFGSFRQLMRLLGVKLRLAMAEGRAGEGLDMVLLGLRFSRAIDDGTFQGTITSAGLRTIITTVFVEHLEQLSAGDCERLYRESAPFLAGDSLAPKLLRREWQEAQESLGELRQAIRRRGAAAVRDFAEEHLSFEARDVEPDPDDPGAPEQPEEPEGVLFWRALLQRYGKSPAGMLRFADDLEARLRERSQELIAEVAEPWRQGVPSLDREAAVEDPAGTIVEKMLGMADHLSSQVVEWEVQHHLFLIHLALLRYRWEHDRVPDTLAELALGDLTFDPFTGLELKYEPVGTRGFQLYSAGPYTHPYFAETPGERRRIFLRPID
ncbi:MAG: hypothetical protein ACK47B_03795 [Armatimonadota bacterium]